MMNFSFTITFGWWLVPLLISIFLIVKFGMDKSDAFGFGLFCIAIPGTLISWLVWSLLINFGVIGF